VAYRANKRNVCRILVKNPERNVPIGIHWRRQEDNTELGLKIIG
jgi:hypothetical protein